MVRGWAPPEVVTVSPLAILAGTNRIATVDGCYRRHADVHIVSTGVTLDGATVQLYALADDIWSLVGEGVIGAATLETIGAVTERRGLIVGVREVMARAFHVVIISAVSGANLGKLTLAAWS